jgi:hypothetical protein
MSNRKLINRWIIFFIVCLVISGATAIPVVTELEFATRMLPRGTAIGDWLDIVYMAVLKQQQESPYLAYGYDWLAFAHFVLAILFIGPLKDPVRNVWVIEFGMIACALVIPYGLIAGSMRGLPFWWRLVDCSFGVIGFIPLLIVRRKIDLLEDEEDETAN